jgi:hypothetical protein
VNASFLGFCLKRPSLKSARRREYAGSGKFSARRKFASKSIQGTLPGSIHCYQKKIHFGRDAECTKRERIRFMKIFVTIEMVRTKMASVDCHSNEGIYEIC